MECYTPGDEKLANEHRQRMEFVIGCLRNLGKEKRPIAAGDIVVVLDEDTTYESLHVIGVKENGMVQVSEAPKESGPNTLISDVPRVFEAPLSDVYHIRDWNEAFETALQYQQKVNANRLS